MVPVTSAKPGIQIGPSAATVAVKHPPLFYKTWAKLYVSL